MKTNHLGRGYTAGQAAEVAKVAYHHVNYWAKTGFITPSIQDASGSDSCRVYGFQDLVALRVAGELREAGISLQSLRKVVEYLRHRGYSNPLADAYLLVTPDGDVLEKKNDELASVLKAKGQRRFFWVFDLGGAVKEVYDMAISLTPASRGKASRVA